MMFCICCEVRCEMNIPEMTGYALSIYKCCGPYWENICWNLCLVASAAFLRASNKTGYFLNKLHIRRF